MILHRQAVEGNVMCETKICIGNTRQTTVEHSYLVTINRIIILPADVTLLQISEDIKSEPLIGYSFTRGPDSNGQMRNNRRYLYQFVFISS